MHPAAYSGRIMSILSANSAGAQRAAQALVALSAVVLLGCWGLASLTASLAIYAAGWVAGVGGASSAALLYRMWTAGRPDLQQRTQTMTLGLVGWLIVIGLGMTLFRALASPFVEVELASMDWAVWLLPVLLVCAAGAWALAWRAGQSLDHTPLQRHAPQHLATVAALALAEAGLLLAQVNDGARWADVIAGVFAVGVGMAWSWLRLWRRIGAQPSEPTAQDAIDPALSAKAREALDAAQQDQTIVGYDRLAIEPSPAGTRISVRLHLPPEQALADARESSRQVERALEALLPAGTVVALIEPAAHAPATPAPPPTTTPDDPPPADR